MSDSILVAVAVAAVAAAVVVVLVLACGSEKTGGDELTLIPPKMPNQPKAAAPEATLEPTLVTRLKLPKRTVDARSIIWRTQAQVEKVLGAGLKRGDGKWRHDLEKGIPQFVVITYERGHAVGIELMLAGDEWDELNESERNKVDEWFHVDNTGGRVNGRNVLVGPSFLGGGFALYEKQYLNALQARVAKETAKAEREAQRQLAIDEATRQLRLARGREHLRLLSREIARRGMSGMFSVGINPEVVLFDGPCTRNTIDDLAKRMGESFRSFGFTRIECLDLSAPL